MWMWMWTCELTHLSVEQKLGPFLQEMRPHVAENAHKPISTLKLKPTKTLLKSIYKYFSLTYQMGLSIDENFLWRAKIYKTSKHSSDIVTVFANLRR